MEEIITTQSETFRTLITRIDAASTIAGRLLTARKITFCGEHYLSGEELCNRFYISRRTLQDYRDNSIIPYTSIGGKILYPESAIEKLLQDNYQSAISSTSKESYNQRNHKTLNF